MRDADFVQWFEALEKRHLANLNFSEVRRAVQALSSLYVERRGRLAAASALDAAGKRAAFALFFGSLHFLLVREVIRGLQARVPAKAGILDIGCGTGVAGAAWALEMDHRPRIIGVDRNSWVLQECRWTYRSLGISGAAKSADLNTLQIPAETAVVAAFTINELDSDTRDRFHDDFLRIAQKGLPVLVIEPIARRLTSWWDDWARDWTAAGGREDHWRFRIELPERLALMDRAAGLDHQELTGRSLWLPGKP
ncbi:MAG TPA: class I SAM-dependent methyltransferase [Terriglobia bacterium]|nr:class I SAM-dependent methyltransferase [Terriglobia bacterium]